MSRPLRVLLVDHAPIFGGVEAMLCDLVSHLDRSQIEPIIVTAAASPALERFRRVGAEVRLVPLGRLKSQGLAGPRLVRSAIALSALARQERADLIHTFTARTHVIGALAGRLSRHPVLWRLNDDTLPLPIAQLFSRLTRRVITVSHFLAGRYHSLPAPISVIPDGLPSQFAQHSISSVPPHVHTPIHPHTHTPVVTLVARLVRWKGHAVFIRALALVAQRLPDIKGEIVGTASPEDDRPGLLAGGPSYARELADLAASLGLQDRLTFTGFREPRTLFAGSSLAIHASLLPEPFGRVMVEAMAAGLPVIAARGGAVPEIVVNGLTGRLVPAGDVEALADAIVALMSDPPRRQAMGRAGQARAAKHFSVEQMVSRFEAAWQAACC